MVSPVKGENGQMLTDIEQIRNEWNAYYKRLYSWNGSVHDDTEFANLVNASVECACKGPPTQCELDVGPITVTEIQKQIGKMKLRKAPGWDNVTAEHLKNIGPLSTATLTWVINEIVASEVMPQHLKRGLIAPIPKPKKDATVKDNNRGITLLPVIYKLLEMVILDREKPWLAQRCVVDDLQGAGQENCSSLHVSMVLQEAIAFNTERGSNVYIVFIDTKKAFDTVWIPGLLFKLLEQNFTSSSRKL